MRIHSDTGFTLIEILVAMVLTAIGLAGSFALFARTVQLHQQGVAHMRANRLANSVADGLTAAGALTPASQSQCDSGDASACDALDRRQQWLREATRHARSALPQGSLALHAAGQDTWEIRVQWQPPLAVQASTYRVRIAAQ